MCVRWLRSLRVPARSRLPAAGASPAAAAAARLAAAEPPPPAGAVARAGPSSGAPEDGILSSQTHTDKISCSLSSPPNCLFSLL